MGWFHSTGGYFGPMLSVRGHFPAVFRQQLGWNCNVWMASVVSLHLAFQGSSSKMKHYKRIIPHVQAFTKPLLAPHLIMSHWPKPITWLRLVSRAWLHKGMNTRKCFTGGTKVTGCNTMFFSNILWEKTGLFPSDKVTNRKQVKHWNSTRDHTNEVSLTLKNISQKS